MEIVLNAVLQLVYLTAPILLCGLLISFCNRAWLKLAGVGIGNHAVFLTGLIGTPVHELGHAAACIVFFHHITGMRLWSFDLSDGVLGYVKHTYNPHSIYQRIGNFVIAIAPILSGCGILLVGYILLVGDVDSIYRAIPTEALSAVEMYSQTFKTIGIMLSDFFSIDSLKNPLWWLYLFIGLCIALHINLGADDIEDSGVGFIALVVLVAFVNVVLGLLGSHYLETANRYLMVYNCYLCVFLCLAVLFSLMLVLLAALIYLVRTVFRGKEKEYI